MKILTVADFFYPEIVGGSAVVAYQLMRELTERGHDITVLTRQQETQSSIGEVDGIRIYRYPFPTSQAFYPLAVLKATKMIRGLLTDQRYDLINAHHASSGLAVAILNGYLGYPPSVFFFHGPWHREAMAKDGLVWTPNGRTCGCIPERNASLRLGYFLRRGIDRFILRRCTAVVTLSEYMFREALKIFPFLGHKSYKIPSGVDIKRFSPADNKTRIRRELGLPSDRLILLTVRRLSPRMGLENLVRAMATVERRQDDVMLIIGGKGELQDRLNQLILELGLQRTLLIGYIHDEDLPKYYQASDLFIMPSVTLEGFGLSTLEALACGMPVLGTSTGGTPEILRGVLPDFILPGVEAQDIADRILQKIPCLKDPALQTRARQFAEGFSWARMTDSVEALFQELVHRR